jgi:hypothetical protein
MVIFMGYWCALKNSYFIRKGILSYLEERAAGSMAT